MAYKNELVTVTDLERGLRFGHLLMSINRHVSREGTVFAQALIELLLNKGVITTKELDERIAVHRQALQQNPQVMLSKGPDKDNDDGVVIIDCASRLHLCRALCCTFRFYLSPQDLDEGIIRWDYGNPYWVRQQEGGYCVHCNLKDWSCNIHPHRPHPCRTYDCRKDKRVWVDFEQRIPNPDLHQEKNNGPGNPG